MSEFLGGIRLSQRFYEEAIKPILAACFPSLAYAAALIGSGSEVLGYDTPLSTDHDWGPRLLLFLSERDYEAETPRLESALRQQLPPMFRGYPTHFALSREGPEAPARHRVEIHAARAYFTARLGFDPYAPPRVTDWLIVPEQMLLALTAGAVFHDGTGQITALRRRLAYYPRDVWLYLMAAQWRRIAQQEAFVGRTGDVGDELGSSLIAATLVRDLMRLCFLIEQRYAPYSKWFGTAFAQLACGPACSLLFTRVLRATEWRRREEALAEAYAAVITLHNTLAITPPMETDVSPFYTRPYRVIHAERVAEALLAAITEPLVRNLPAYGSIDQLSDSTDFLASGGRVRTLYE